MRCLLLKFVANITYFGVLIPQTVSEMGSLQYNLLMKKNQRTKMMDLIETILNYSLIPQKITSILIIIHLNITFRCYHF